MKCEFKRTGEVHLKTGRAKWACSRNGCDKVCWGDEPANAHCRDGETPPKPAARVLFAELPCVHRGESRSEPACCGGWVQVARCAAVNGDCTVRGVAVNEQTTARCSGCLLRKA